MKRMSNHQQCKRAPIVFLLLRLTGMLTLVGMLLSQSSHPENSSVFFRQDLLSLFSYQTRGNPVFDIPKLLLTCSVFLTGFFAVIVSIGDLADSYRFLLRLRSSTVYHYIKHKLLFVLYFYLCDSVVWLVSMLSLVVYFGEGTFLLSLLLFLCIQLQVSFLISLICRHSTSVFLCYFLSFLAQEWLVTHPVEANLVLFVFLGVALLLHLRSEG